MKVLQQFFDVFELVITVFLFSILGMGMGPSELGKSVHKNWKLGKLKHLIG